MGYSLLLIEAEGLTTESLSASLGEISHTLSVVHTPEAAEVALHHEWPDLIIFNLLDGSLDLATFKAAISRSNLRVPCLAVSHEPLSETVIGESPLDRVLHPPCTTEMLSWEVAQLVTRERFLRAGDITLDLQMRTLLRNGQCHKLTPKLAKLLHLLVKNEGHVVYRKTIMQEVWETEYMGDTRTLDVHVRWIREKIEDNPSRPRRLLTVRGSGYFFVSHKS